MRRPGSGLAEHGQEMAHHGRPRVVENRVEWCRDAWRRLSPSTIARCALARAPALRRPPTLPQRHDPSTRAFDRAEPQARGSDPRTPAPRPGRWRCARAL